MYVVSCSGEMKPRAKYVDVAGVVHVGIAYATGYSVCDHTWAEPLRLRPVLTNDIVTCLMCVALMKENQ